MFAFVVVAGAWLRLVRPEPMSPGRRRLVASATAGAAAVPASLAFREAAWDLVGQGGARGAEDLAILVATAGLATSAVVLAALALAGWPR